MTESSQVIKSLQQQLNRELPSIFKYMLRWKYSKTFITQGTARTAIRKYSTSKIRICQMVIPNSTTSSTYRIQGSIPINIVFNLSIAAFAVLRYWNHSKSAKQRDYRSRSFIQMAQPSRWFAKQSENKIFLIQNKAVEF